MKRNVGIKSALTALLFIFSRFAVHLPKINEMNKFTFFLLFILVSEIGFSQNSFNLYNPEADAEKDIAEAVAKAKSENKYVFLQLGGNWCGWCKVFHELTTQDEELKNYIEANFEVVHVNYSKENTNEKVLASLDYPQRFGFPVFVILDQNGKRIHTQNSGYLEEGNGHSKKKILEFLNQWSPAALNPKNYIKK